MKTRQLAIGLVAVLALLVVPTATSAQASTPPAVYYLALGDSLSTGGGSTPGHSYVDDIYAQLSRDIPGLVLKNLGCGGDSTTRMIHGGLCHGYTTGDQLGDAELFLSSHQGQVAFVTIDVGGDDIVGCGLSGTINQTCIANALQAVTTNLPIIMWGLRTAGGNLPIVGMSYYDPLLAAWYSGAWFHGPASETTARESLPVLNSLNDDMIGIYGQYRASVADVQRPFQSGDWKLTGSFMGVALPQNVANICNWTQMCIANPTIHTNDYGHSLIAAAYEKVLRVPPTLSGDPPTASIGIPYRFQFNVGGYPSVRVSKVGKLPKGLTLSNTGLLSGTPTQSGTFPITIKASDLAGSAMDTTQVLVNS
jgi:lysophospholipase L1-like esterase